MKKQSISFQSSVDGRGVLWLVQPVCLPTSQVRAAGWDIQTSSSWNSSQDTPGIQDGVVCAFKEDMQVQSRITSWLMKM